MERSRIFSLFKTLLFSYILTGLLLLLLAFGLYKFHLKESQITIGVNAIYIITCFIGGFIAGKSIRQRRFFWGLCLGFLYFACLFLASFAITKTLPENLTQSLLNLAMCAGSATLGGMLS
ncbi:MAG: TIGR04086 family membrane protein [bacterium]|nr:TIGR04086 family membrane protein [bacterium]